MASRTGSPDSGNSHPPTGSGNPAVLALASSAIETTIDAARHACSELETAFSAGVITVENYLESDLRQSLAAGFAAGFTERSIPHVLRLEQQVKLRECDWAPKRGSAKRNRPGGVDLDVRLFRDAPSASAEYFEIACETKWAASWTGLYDSIWDVLKLAAYANSDCYPLRCGMLAILAYVAPASRWPEPSGGKAPGGTVNGARIGDTWVARQIFTGARTGDVTPTRVFYPRQFIQEHPDHWASRITNHKDVGSLPLRIPGFIKISPLVTRPLSLGAGTSSGEFELRVIGFGAEGDIGPFERI